MKKTLVAIAALVATGAFAQSASTLNQPAMATLPTAVAGSSSFTIGGMIDAGYAVTTAPTGAVTNNVQSTTASRLRFVGVQDLGSGLKGTFWLEMQPSVTDGTVNSSALFNRAAWASLSGGFGEVRLGRQGTNTINAVITPDIQQGGAFYGFSGGGLLFSGMAGTGAQGGAWFAANPTRGGVTQTGAGSTAQVQATSTQSKNYDGTSSSDSTRYDRAIRYATPTIAGGLTVGVTTAFGATGGNGAGGSQGFDATYAAGPLRAVLAYQKANAEAGNDQTGSLTTLAGNYDFSSFILGGAVQSEKASGTGIIFNTGKSFALVGMLPLGAARPYVKLGNHSYDTIGTNAKIFNIGSTYNLSKSTLVYADFTRNSATMTGTSLTATAAASPRLIVIGTQINF